MELKHTGVRATKPGEMNRMPDSLLWSEKTGGGLGNGFQVHEVQWAGKTQANKHALSNSCVQGTMLSGSKDK
jgi:hypothetical protein